MYNNINFCKVNPVF